MTNSKIAWCDHTFNPWIGCSKVSTGCENCYAERLSGRWGWAEWGCEAVRKRTSQSYWQQPWAWKLEAIRSGARPRVFCGSLCDWLDMRVSGIWLQDLLNVIELTPQLTWMLLTKRPENFQARMEAGRGWCRGGLLDDWTRRIMPKSPANVWLGISAENQEQLERRVNLLVDIPAALHFVSAEPLLGPLDFEGDVAGVADWVIVGGESGPAARPMKAGWVRDIRDDCLAAGVPFFFKGWGGRTADSGGNRLDGRIWHEFPTLNP